MIEYDSEKYQIQNYHREKWEEYKRIELAWFAQDARDNYMLICKELDFLTWRDIKEILEKIKELRTEAAKAQPILDDWQRLKKHLEMNPTIKEEWEGILMAIRLTEED